MSVEMGIVGFKEFQKALQRNPAVVKQELRNYHYRAIATLTSAISRSPWRVGSRGGGVPYDAGDLMRASANTEYSETSARIYTDLASAPYGLYVHNGTSKMKARPYYDYAVETNRKKLEDYQESMLKKIVEKLAE